jgi:hypothetical protein
VIAAILVAALSQAPGNDLDDPRYSFGTKWRRAR